MTKKEREAAKLRCKAATDGPWTLEAYGGREYDTLVANSIDGEPLDEPTPVLEEIELGSADLEANWYFIEHARTDLPAALADVERWKELAGKLYKALVEPEFAVEIGMSIATYEQAISEDEHEN